MIHIGRKGKYDEWLTEDGLMRVHGWARDGLNDEQIAANMGIGTSAFYEWQNKFPELAEAIKKGKAPVDTQVENALLKRALGYEVEETITEVEEVPTGRIDENGRPVMKTKKHVRKVQRHIPADTTAQIFWLKNRRPGKWRDKIEAAPETANELLQSLFDLERRSGND